MTKNPLFASFDSDTNLEVNGAWLYPVGEFDGAPAFKVARAGGANKAFEKAQMSGMKPHRQLIQASAKNPTPEALTVIKDVTMRSFIDHCMKGWKNVKNKEEVEVPFSKEAAADFFKQLPDLYESLIGDAQNLLTYQTDDVEQDSGNS